MSAFESTPRKRFSDQHRARIFLERHGCCRECGRSIRPGEQWVLEHIIPLSMGGSNDDDNLGVTCGWCVPAKNAVDAKSKAKARRTATKHVLPKSERQRQGFRGWRKFNGEVVWNDR